LIISNKIFIARACLGSDSIKEELASVRNRTQAISNTDGFCCFAIAGVAFSKPKSLLGWRTGVRWFVRKKRGDALAVMHGW